MKKVTIVILLVVTLFMILAGCTPKEEPNLQATIDASIIQTQTSMSTNTNTPEPTATYTSAPTLTHTSIPTETPTLTPTPDLRVIKIESKEFLLTKDDLPTEAKYYIPNSGWMSPHHNDEIIQGWGKEKGLEYLDKTGRIDGWWVYFDRGVNTVRAPEEIFHNIIQYKTSEGAYLSLTKYGTRIDDPDYDVINVEVLIGDGTIGYIRKTMQSSGEYRTSYIIETSYLNYISVVGGWGWDKDFDLEYVITVAEIAMEKLKAAPLENW